MDPVTSMWMWVPSGLHQLAQEKHSANAESVYAMESIRIAIKAVHERTSVTLQNGRPLTYVVGHFLVRSHTVHPPI